MAEERVQRRLAAILAADVVGYSRLMGADESGTRSRFNEQLESTISPAIEKHGGRLVKTMGDGFLVEFASVIEAVQCAVDVQTGVAAHQVRQPEEKKMLLRIGVHLGDVIVEGDDIHGEGVNIAARLEEMSDAGGISISDMVRVGVGNRLALAFTDLGDQHLKNIAEPVRVYRVELGEPLGPGSAKSDSVLRRPALAVLPFENLSGDPEQEYFADGLTEDIITALSQWLSVPVIARNSTFAYKGKSPDIREVGKALGARYVVEGSVRKAGSSVRVTAQLINADTGHHIWAQRYDRELEDIFSLQDEITARIAAIIEPAIAGAEQKQLAARPPRELSAWDLCIQGQYLIYESTKESNERAREKFRQAIDVDPEYARAWSGLAYTYMHDVRLGYAESNEEWRRNAFDAARKAVALDDSDAEAHTYLARALNMSGQTENALAAIRQALDINPQNTAAIMTIAVISAFRKNEPEEGIRWLERSLEINPIDPRNFFIKTHLAVANICAGNFERAAEVAREATRQRADYLEPHAALASALGYLGRADEAAQAIGGFRDRVVEYAESYPIWDRKTKDAVLGGLRKAGLIE